MRDVEKVIDWQRVAACMNFCEGVPTEELQQGLGIFVEAKLESKQRLMTPKLAKAIKILKGASL